MTTLSPRDAQFASAPTTSSAAASPAGTRSVAVDAVKGISILLVVVLHAGTYWHLNEFFRLIRMPLFFFAAGLFAASSMKLPWRAFLTRKAGNTFYIYILWVFVGWALRLLPYAFTENPFDNFPTVEEVVAPTGVLWFMYAVGFCYLIARAIRDVPAKLAIGVAMICSIAITYLAGDDAEFFAVKIVRLLPFFLIALNYHQEIKDMARRHAKFWPLAMAVYILVYFLRPDTTTVGYALLAPVLSLIGIAWVFLFCVCFERQLLVRIVAVVGSFSLAIYLMHGPIIFHFQRALPEGGVQHHEAIALLVVVPIVAICMLVAKLLIKPHLEWLFVAPWLIKRRRRATAA